MLSMRFKSSVLVITLMVVSVSIAAREGSRGRGRPNTLSSREERQGFALLFDGEGLLNFKGAGKDDIPKGAWVVKDGLIVSPARADRAEGAAGGSIVTKKQFSDFDFRLEYRIDPDFKGQANSGIKYFAYPGTELGLEYQIFDHDAMVSGPHAVGDLYDLMAASEHPARPRGQWNRVRIVSQGKHVEHWLNGRKILEFERGSEAFRKAVANSKFKDREAFGELEQGPILLQDHGGGVAFRNIRIMAGRPAGQVTFEMHRVGTLRSEACCVGDFNGDGKIDILAGSFWYENPTWEKHQFRAIEDMVDPDGNKHVVDDQGKGYFDDFLNAAVDVDGDGLDDVVTCGWFSKRIDWYRNTGKAGGAWPVTVAHVNGNFETGDLVDIDGDGKKNEVLGHTQSTKWYEAGKVDGKPNLVTHLVSEKPMNFGGGVGDINGDGRPDIVRPDGWFAAPEDIRNGQWKEYPLAVGAAEEGKSDHTPQIVVYDVDGDGLNDLITSSAHKYGIWWYQQKHDGETISWVRNEIDKSWSQAHSISLVDLDQDGDLDFVTGKRFYAHNGGDPGSGEPLGVYWYELQRREGRVRWVKHEISYNQGIGAALNIPVADIDGDGDMDLVATGKWGGPVWFENKLK